ncbi:rab3 GTPase-activating protein non-catalytic subunit-like isoform X3 [Lineus longissimus]|uniref:rab3 GTPase-activating protein non-catalytic subunit-like isoform X3 n=1 Tax=Lineus longissimus TaxID=88925 RepID=UPI00315DD479
MSCQLNIVAKFQDISSIRNYLFPNLIDVTPSSESSAATEGGWDELEWGWKVDDEESVEAQDSRNEEAKSWLQKCILSVSPTLDHIALAVEDRIVILNQKWDAHARGENQMKFSISMQGSLKQDDKGVITSVMCLPLYSQKRSSQGGPDWTCIIVGFSTGYVRMYTESGALLISQLLHEEPVLKVKCKTYAPPRYMGDSETLEDLTILYPKALVCIDGFSFFQTIRACRNQVAKAAASGGETIQPPPLAYKKWGLQHQDFITDHVSAGVLTPMTFDQMQTASMLGGFSATIKATPPAASLYLTAGLGPYVGFFYAVEGNAQPLLSDVAMAVANKLKTAIFSAASWFGTGARNAGDEEKKKKPKVEPSTPLSVRFGLPDQRRQSDSLSLSPNEKLVATTDSFGRVILIDVEMGTAVRMWKGYRDAQVGWVEVKEELHSREEKSKHRYGARLVLFLVIYAPKRGLLEVWTAQQGMRVAAFNVSKWCQLICPGYGMMGLNNVTCKEVKAQIFQVCLVGPDGAVKTIDVPFHLALSDKNSKRARDLHLIKKLKAGLRETYEEGQALFGISNPGLLETDVIGTLSEIKTPAIKMQAVERVLSTRYLSSKFMENVLESVMAGAKTEGAESTEESQDMETKRFLQYCRAEKQLIDMYEAIIKLNTQDTMMAVLETPEQVLTSGLSMGQTEAQAFLYQVDTYRDTYGLGVDKRRVHFGENGPMNLSAFLGCFDCHTHRSEGDASSTVGATVTVKSTLSDEKCSTLASFIFQKSISGTSLIDDLMTLLQVSGLPPDELLSLLLHIWLSGDRTDINLLTNLRKLLMTISTMKDVSEVVVDHSELSPWWELTRRYLIQSTNIMAALTAALVGRSVALEMPNTQVQLLSKDKDSQSLKSMESSASSKVDLSDWESVTIDVEQWSILIRQLEDALALICLLQAAPVKPKIDDATPTPSSEPLTVSIHSILEGGRGVFPELVSKWAMRSGVRPTVLFEEPQRQTSFTSEEESMEVGEEASGSAEQENEISVKGLIKTLRLRLPKSLEQDILMANCSWEYIAEWNRDPEVVDNFANSVEFLKFIENSVLKHGICSMMWHTFVMKRMASAATLMEKVGKAPKDRLCRRDVGMSDVSLVKFLALVCDFLEAFMEANCDADSEDIPVFNVEDLWQEIKGRSALVDLAVDKPPTNYGLLKHHFVLVVLMQAIMEFSIKSVKVLSLFDTKGQNCFFKEFHSHPLLPNHNLDIAILSQRRQFLTKIISQAVQALADTFGVSEKGTPEPLACVQYTKWNPLVIKIAEDFCVDIDYLRRHHVCELYSHGFDKLAEEVLLTVNDHAVMGSQLILLAGQRLAHFLYNCDPDDTVAHLAKLSPTLSTWLKSLDAYQLKCPNPPINYTATLIGQTVNQLPEGHSEYNLAISLVDIVQNFT